MKLFVQLDNGRMYTEQQNFGKSPGVERLTTLWEE